jgi:hypothetical protein
VRRNLKTTMCGVMNVYYVNNLMVSFQVTP